MFERPLHRETQEAPPVLQPEEPAPPTRVPIVRVCVSSTKSQQPRQRSGGMLPPKARICYGQIPVSVAGGAYARNQPVQVAFQRNSPVMPQQPTSATRMCFPQPKQYLQNQQLQQRYGTMVQRATPMSNGQYFTFVPMPNSPMPQPLMGCRGTVKRPASVPLVLVPMNDRMSVAAKKYKKEAETTAQKELEERINQENEALLKEKTEMLKEEVYRRRQLTIMEVYRRSNAMYNWEKSLAEQLL
ncbi:hypothetical protein QR680_015448 [Steinernema hermaphroditum]|uniref:Uncharacterized protein n=1 Tax=Steinernema hermaphroditum TaxID=289476 RepID=A0AA39H9M8_9BILA|nr:hypothetical protein QR680_015448 [Steinernema hermaphroditum]